MGLGPGPAQRLRPRPDPTAPCGRQGLYPTTVPPAAPPEP